MSVNIQQTAWVVTPTQADSQQVLEFGKSQGWNCEVLGHAPMPEEPVRIGNWLAVPADLDMATSHPRVQEKLRALTSAGLAVKGVVIVHEQPQQETAGPLPTHLHPTLKSAGIALGGLALAILVIAGLGAALLAILTGLAAVLLPLALLVGVFALDPVLVVVCGEDNAWVELERWT
jgi:hypothetical protein